MSRPDEKSDVAAVFRGYPKASRDKLAALRRLILETAAATEGVGTLEETLKWGQPSYLTTATKSGSTIRLDQVKSASNQYAMYFHCQTDLVATLRALYPSLPHATSRLIITAPPGSERHGCDRLRADRVKLGVHPWTNAAWNII